MGATMRNGVSGEVTDLESSVLEQSEALAVTIPGFGHVVIGGEGPTSELVVRMAPRKIIAALFQPPSEPGGMPPAPCGREALLVDDHMEVELLPNVSGEDRLVVCVPLADIPLPSDGVGLLGVAKDVDVGLVMRAPKPAVGRVDEAP